MIALGKGSHPLAYLDDFTTFRSVCILWAGSMQNPADCCY